MNKYLFYLSGEHPTLPSSEVKGVLDLLNLKYKIKKIENQIMITEISKWSPKITKRLALTHKITKILGQGKKLKEAIKNSKLNFKGTYSVRTIKRSSELEAKAGKLIQKNNSNKLEVDLENPEHKILIFYSKKNKEYYITKLIKKIDRGQFEERRAHLRPYQHPSSLHPRISRALINIARTAENEPVLDPMVGTAGILIEAGLLGHKCYGLDIEEKMIRGARENLKKYVQNSLIHLKIGDARELEKNYKRKFKAIITDPPYGISTTTGNSSREELYEEVLNSIYKILSQKGYLVIIFPSDYKFKSKKYEIIETHKQRVHKTLSRTFYVLKKKIKI